MKLQKGSFIKYLNFRICQSLLGFSVDQTDQVMELLNEWFPIGKLKKIDAPFWKDSVYEKELLATIPLTGHDFHKEEM